MSDPRYPEIEPFAFGWLDVGDGNSLYWEQCGNPTGKPAVVLHGGPGSGCSVGMRRLFDPAKYRVVLFDQRNCGRSKPLATDYEVKLDANTTHHLIADIERLREHLEIERWLVWGGSWGSTLAFAYAERHPERVTEMVHVAVTNTTPGEVDWLTRGVGRFFPGAWDRFVAGVPEGDRKGNLALAYNRLLEDSDPSVREKAAFDWCQWEDVLIDLDPGSRVPGEFKWERYNDPVFRYGFARMVTHYFGHAAWLEDGELAANAGRLAGIPGVMVHGQLDFGSPLSTAWAMAKAWPASELRVISEGGHASGGDMTEVLLAAIDGFADR